MTNQNQLVLVKEDSKTLTTTSRIVAQTFGKDHDYVVKKIQRLMVKAADQTFTVSEYKDSTGRTLPEYKMNREGFMILALGFTGQKADSIRIKFVQAFKEMEDKLRELQNISNKPVSSLESLRAVVDQLILQEKQLTETQAKLTLVVTTQADSPLTSAQVSELDAVIGARFKSTYDKVLAGKLVGRIKKAIKACFFDKPASRTYKEIPQSGFQTALEIARTLN